MWIADAGVVLSLVVLGVVLAAPLLTRRATAAWAAGVAAAALWVGHALVVQRVAAAGGGPTGLDRAALDWVLARRAPGWEVVGEVLAVVGGPGAMAVLTGVAVVLLGLRGRYLEAGLVTAAGLGGWALVEGLKPLYARARPPLDVQVLPYTNPALPSGHAVGSLVVVGAVAAVAWLGPWPRQARVATAVATAAFVVAVGASRVYLAAHWATDVLAGWLVGGAWLVVTLTVFGLLARRTAAQPVSDRTSQVVTPPRS